MNQTPQRTPESPAGPIIRLSLIVYAAVIAITLLVVGIWWWVGASRIFDKPVRPTRNGGAVVQGMAYVAGGTFLAGADKRPVTLNPFYIDQTEVTAGDFCNLMRCDNSSAKPDLPVVNVTIAQARLYAMRLGKRLPTPLEWERAARGVKGNLFPWGDTEDPRLANVADNPSFGGRQLVAAKSFQPYPEYQMVGNVWEIVEGSVTPTPEALASFANLLKPAPTATERWIAVRGGSFLKPLSSDIVWEPLIVPERYSAPDIGFRLVKDP